MQITIFTGDTQVGKSNHLLQMVKKDQTRSYGGFITPTMYGLKYFYDIEKDKYSPFQSIYDSEKTITIGRYHIFNDGFTLGSRLIYEMLNQQFSRTIIIDEIGKLELRKNGFHDALVTLFDRKVIEENQNLSLLLVIRKDLLHEVIDYFQIPSGYLVVNYPP